MTVRMAVVIDYQNVHLTAAQLFLPGRPIEEGLRVKMCVWLGVSRGLDLAFLNAD